MLEKWCEPIFPSIFFKATWSQVAQEALLLQDNYTLAIVEGIDYQSSHWTGSSGETQWQSPVHQVTSQPFTLTFTSMTSIESLINRTHTSTSVERTCELHKKRPRATRRMVLTSAPSLQCLQCHVQLVDVIVLYQKNQIQQGQQTTSTSLGWRESEELEKEQRQRKQEEALDRLVWPVTANQEQVVPEPELPAELWKRR